MTQQLSPNANYAVIGLGTTGLSCVRFLQKHGITPLVCDTRAEPPGHEQLPDGVELIRGELPQQRLLEMDWVIVSPGVPLTHPVLARLTQAAVPLIGDIEVFSWYAKAPVVAITGSNGKSTVTTMLGDIAEQAGCKVAVGGNIGVPALDLIDESVELYVLELSSFQLETTVSLRAAAATVLNISEDHMDRYPDLAAYIAAKHVIYQGAQCCVVNADDAQTHPENAIAEIKEFSIVEARDYSLDAAQAQLSLPGESWPLEHLPLVGEHNLANALAAVALADAVNLPREASKSALQSYQGLAHRCQVVANKQQVLWVNDSKATNVGATVAAIEGLKSQANKIWLIVGGDSKAADLAPLSAALEQVAGCVAFGRDKQRFAAQDPNTTLVADMAEAVAWCAQQAQAGDLVLLSPACASLDMYKNFEVRGQHFAELVEAL